MKIDRKGPVLIKTFLGIHTFGVLHSSKASASEGNLTAVCKVSSEQIAGTRTHLGKVLAGGRAFSGKATRGKVWRESIARESVAWENAARESLAGKHYAGKRGAGKRRRASSITIPACCSDRSEVPSAV